MYTQNRVLLFLKPSGILNIQRLSYTVFNLCNKAGWSIRHQRMERRDHLRNHTQLTHLSDYQLASVAFIVCIYSKSRLFY